MGRTDRVDEARAIADQTPRSARIAVIIGGIAVAVAGLPGGANPWGSDVYHR